MEFHRRCTREQPVHVIDIAPTVSSWQVSNNQKSIQVTEPPLQGRSFVKCLTDPTASPMHETLWWCHDGHRAVRQNNWKLVAARDEPNL